MLKLVSIKHLNGRWNNYRRPIYSQAVIISQSQAVMRLLRASSTTAAIASTVPIHSFTPAAFPQYRCVHTFHITTAARDSLRFTNRLYSTRDLTKIHDDEIEDDLYLLAASDDVTTSNGTVQFASTYHAPVMWKECVIGMHSGIRATERKSQKDVLKNDDVTTDHETESTIIKSPLIFVDGTLGGGGHSQALLESLLPGDIVFGADVDPDALRTATERLSQYTLKQDGEHLNKPEKPWFIPVPSNFADITPQLLRDQLLSKCNDVGIDISQSPFIQEIQSDGVSVDGILLDLGVSSYQIDTAERGFAFMKDGPLDMRMDRQGANNKRGSSRLTAADLCNEMDLSELRRIFQTYGDERRARSIAESIIRRRPLVTTNDLFEAVAEVTPQFARKGRRMGRMATMARIFQSLRIVVNQEDVVLERALTKMAPDLLRPGGRLVVLSYHSMEDRATKRVMRDGTVSKREAERNNEQKDMYGNFIGDPKPFRAVGKARKATPEEVKLNARARSATLRIAERL